ncbi:galactose mutarotase [Arthrobacter alpinus]|uniref:Galactose mutarotase n=1 Tax=Arthrobacter alpinus TaxID=656366 RepID=A0A0S2LXP4_9MICC|nr:aldose 1-epimerase family protein [Arthrobacter alpinus]ALO66097.1 galactose mutarotase [Arthrobacter alpinus]
MSNNPRRPLSGAQFNLESGDYRAVVASVGATLRSLTHAGRNLVVPFDADQVRPAYRGANLAPWPNRLADGAYSYNGEQYQVPINEVERMTALHGLVLWNEWEPRAQTPDSVTLGAIIEPQAGYPHRLAIEVRFELSAAGLDWRITATNIGTGISAAPYGVAPHPYLVAGSGTVDTWTLELPAAKILQVTPDRLLPTELADVATHDDGYFDFQHPRTLGATEIDHAYTALSPADSGGATEVRVLAAEGTGVLMRWNARTLPWVQIHTADTASPETNRIGLAVEPMTCPPDAFNSGRDLIALGTGERHEASWVIAAL